MSPATYPDVLAYPTTLATLPAFGRRVLWARGSLPAWPTHLLGPHGCDAFAGRTDTYGGKPVLFDPVRREPLFAEQLILRALTAPGATMSGGVWLDAFGGQLRDECCRRETFASLPARRDRQLRRICTQLGAVRQRCGIGARPKALFCGGTWDVFCWRDPGDLCDALFVESKAPGDRFSEPPAKKEPMWLEAALEASASEGWGWTEANFLVLEWTPVAVGSLAD